MKKKHHNTLRIYLKLYIEIPKKNSCNLLEEESQALLLPRVRCISQVTQMADLYLGTKSSSESATGNHVDVDMFLVR